MVDLLTDRHRQGRRFEPTEFLEEGARVAVGLAVTDSRWEGRAEIFKVFTFEGGGDRILLLRDCLDRDDALAQLAAG